MDTRAWTMQVKKYMKENYMAEEGDGILAAVSGGADSVCLLLVLKELAEELGIRVAAFHLNHGLRGEEADRDEAYVRDLCAELDIPLDVVREDVRTYAAEHRMSEEEAGRVLRYLHLEQTAKEFDCEKIATAHHRDDQVETVLMNLFRGSGLRGLGGIRPVRGNIIRPLLGVTKQEIETYLYKKKVVWCEDSTNRETAYGRNKVRNSLIPWVQEQVNDQASDHILKTAEFAAEADAYFASQADKMIDAYAASPFGEYDSENGLTEKMARSIAIPTAVFDAQPKILKPYLVRNMIHRLNASEKDITARHIDAICTLTGPGGGTKSDLPHGLCAVRGYDVLEIRRAVPGSFMENHGFSMEMRTFPWKKDLEIPKNQYTKWFDCDKIETTLSVRTRESGDYYMIGDGKRKLLKRFFIDQKIPEAVRGEIPLLADGNHILWIIGHRISEYYKVSDLTRTILEVRIHKGEKNG